VPEDKSQPAFRHDRAAVGALAELVAEGKLRHIGLSEAGPAEIDATPAQVASAWLLAHGDDIAPIPGT
jgi:aryl-alcohol dehydrogenase-like predicted oxidoreductase